jgi:hypothetical protein
VHAAYGRARPPSASATALHVARHCDFLEFFGTTRRPRVLEAGLARFAHSPLLWERWRTRVLREKGAAGLLAAAQQRVAAAQGDAQVRWFAGYAALVAAEAERRAARPDAALAAYAQGIAWFTDAGALDPEVRGSGDHYVAMALAGRARVQLELGALEPAVDALLESFARSPRSAATLDGLEVNAVATARMIAARAREAKREDLAGRIDAALAQLDPELLLAPEYEREASAPRRPRRRG